MIIDIHLHTTRTKGVPQTKKGDNFASPEELIAIMDRTGVDMAVLLPYISPECMTQYSPTEDILEICARYQDRFIPFCNIDPRAGSNSPKTDHSRQLLYYKERGCKGVGEVTANLRFDDPIVLNFFKHCEACSMPVLFHIAPRKGGCYGLIDELGLPRLEKVLKRFPDLTIIGHSQPFWAEISGDATEKNRNEYPEGKVAPGGALPRLFDAYPNLYGDISARSGYTAITRDLEFGYAFIEKYQDRLFFGTDCCTPEQDHRHAEYLRGALKNGHISSEAFEKVAWRNANEVLGLGVGGRREDR